MRAKVLWLVAAASLAVVLFEAGPGPLRGETSNSIALTGQVSSPEEGPMEGVLVSAKRAGSTVTITVVSDETGRYGFPRNRLVPGQYALRIRAIGYDLDDTGTVEIGEKSPATADLKLHKAKDFTSQLTNTEWIMSAPGTEAQKLSLLNCVQCHTLERIIKSKHDTAQFLQVLDRMGNYANQSFPPHPQKRLAGRLLEERGEARDRTRHAQAEFLAAVNLSSAAAFAYPLRTLPRPKGRSTRVVITEYDLPRKTIEPHDVVLDSQGMAWYSNFGEQTLGRLDPTTGKVTEYQVPELKHGSPTGELGLELDPAENLWLGMMFQGGIAKFDRKTEKFQTWSIPPEFNKEMTQINMASPQRSTVDGKVWTQNNGFAVIHRVDLATGNVETFQPFKDTKEGQNHNIYDVIPDSHNNAYFTDFANEHIGRIDAKTGEIKLYPTPTPRSAPRRGEMDSEDRLWFGEYKGNRIGMFDTHTEKFQEWQSPSPYAAPYDVVLDKNGEAWTGSMSTDRVLRLDPKTGQTTEYLLPRSTNIRRVFVDNTTTPVTFWVGSNHGASVVKLEPLD
jgi:virginiamycin B lyase